MWDGYGEVPITSRAAEAELERQRARRQAEPLRAAADEKNPGEPGDEREKRPSKGQGRKRDVQKKPEDQRGRPDPKEME